MKKAYMLSRSGENFPEFAQMKKTAVEKLCFQNGYTVIGGTEIFGRMTEEVKEQLLERIKELRPDVLVAHNGHEFGRGTSACVYINQIRNLGVEVESVRGDIPDRQMMPIIVALASVYWETEEDPAMEENEEEVGEEAELYCSESVVKHWDAELVQAEAVQPTCAIYMRRNPERCYCDAPTMEKQGEQLRKYAEELGYTVSDEVRACEKSQDTDSVGLRLLKEVLAKKNIDKVLVQSYDVFSEDALMCAEIIDGLRHCGVEVEQIEDCSLQIRATDFFQMR